MARVLKKSWRYQIGFIDIPVLTLFDHGWGLDSLCSDNNESRGDKCWRSILNHSKTDWTRWSIDLNPVSLDTRPIYPISLTSSLPNLICMHIGQANRTQLELTRSLEADLIAEPSSDKAHRSLGSTKEPGGTSDRPYHSAQCLSDRYGLKHIGLAKNSKERHLVISQSLLYANATSPCLRPIKQAH